MVAEVKKAPEKDGVPEGFVRKVVAVKAAGHVYQVEVLQAESLEAVQSEYERQGKDFGSIVLAIWNQGNRTGAKGVGSTPVRLAVEAKDAQAVEKAVKAHQKSAPGFIQGAPRSKGKARHASGLTAKERKDMGGAVVQEMGITGAPITHERMKEIAVELGIDPSLIG